MGFKGMRCRRSGVDEGVAIQEVDGPGPGANVGLTKLLDCFGPLAGESSARLC